MTTIETLRKERLHRSFMNEKKFTECIMKFKKDFYWGAATAAYQIEGAKSEDGKSESIWDVFTQKESAIARGETGDFACDHYHRYEEDVRLMKEMGLNAYRFSLAWPRILPDGTGEINGKGAAFYDRLIDSLLEKGITPFVTLYHWDLPQILQVRGGFLNPDIAAWFGEYTEAVKKLYGDRVKHYMTFNEPQCVLGCGYRTGVHAPGLQVSLKEQLSALHNLLRAHGTGARILKSIPGAEVGYASCGYSYAPKNESPEDIQAAYERTFQFEPDNPLGTISAFSEPIFTGKYPKEYYEYDEEILPKIAAGDMKLISSVRPDFFAFNIYEGKTVYRKKDGGIGEVVPATGSPKTQMGWEITPINMYWAPKFLYKKYGKKVYITENGISLPDYVFSDGKIHDTYRTEYLKSYLRELRRAANDGETEVAGYFHWSLMDNFEWAEGYKQRFGLIYVDFETMNRVAKDSFYEYKKIIEENGGNL